MRALTFTLILGGVTSAVFGLASPERPAESATAGSFAAQETREVWVYDDFYAPLTIVVAPGTTVQWVNQGFHHHTVTSQTGLFESGPLDRGAKFSFHFVGAGTYLYSCRFHPREMQGVVVVR